MRELKSPGIMKGRQAETDHQVRVLRRNAAKAKKRLQEAGWFKKDDENGSKEKTGSDL